MRSLWQLPDPHQRHVYRPLCYTADIPGAIPAKSMVEKIEEQQKRAKEAHEMLVAGSDPQRQARGRPDPAKSARVEDACHDKGKRERKGRDAHSRFVLLPRSWRQCRS